MKKVLQKVLTIKVLTIAVLVLVIGLGGYYVNKNYASKKVSVTSNKYSLEKVTRANLDVNVQATGIVTGKDAVNIFSFNTGVVEGITVKQGDAIKQGDLFCKINDSATQQAVDNAKVALEHSKLELQALENQMDSLLVMVPIDGKIKTVFVKPGDDVSSMKSAYGGMAVMVVGDGDALEINIPFPSSGKVAEVYTSSGQSVKKGDVLFKLDDKNLRTSIDTKKNEIQQAQNTLNNKERDLAKSTITTPVSGIVSVLNIKNGEIVDNSKLIATITDISEMKIKLPIDELDINKVVIGQKASIKIDDIQGKSFEGKVESISQSGTTTNNVTTYDVIVTINNPENVKIGMNANVTIAVESKENVLSVPVEAIVEKNGKKYVMVSKTGQKTSTNNKQASNKQGSNNKEGQEGQLVEVKTGIKNKTRIEIISGVTENQVIMTKLPESTNTKSSTNKSNQGGMQGGMAGGMPHN